MEGTLLSSASTDKSLKIFDVVNFDMINMIKLSYVPCVIEWIHSSGDPIHTLAISDKESPKIYIYDGRADGTPLRVLEKVHMNPVHIIKYNSKYDVAVSVDKKGMLGKCYYIFSKLIENSTNKIIIIEYWSGMKHNFEFPRNVAFDSKLDTELFEYAKNKTYPISLSFTSDGKKFATLSVDRRVRVFNFLTGKLVSIINEIINHVNSSPIKCPCFV